MEVLAIIPARGGSKSIPLKNMKLLNRKPLIDYSIQAALKSKYVSRIIVSTDNEKIEKYAIKNGIEVPFKRPAKLSNDRASTIDVIRHAINFLDEKESYIPDVVTLLQPTTPFRTVKMIDSSIRLLNQSKADIIIAVKNSKNHPFRTFWYKKFLKPLNKDFLKYHQRQMFPKCYYPTGEIYTFWTKNLKKFNHMYGPKILPLIPKNHISIDIDEPLDFFIAEQIMKKLNRSSTHNISKIF